MIPGGLSPYWAHRYLAASNSHISSSSGETHQKALQPVQLKFPKAAAKAAKPSNPRPRHSHYPIFRAPSLLFPSPPPSYINLKQNNTVYKHLTKLKRKKKKIGKTGGGGRSRSWKSWNMGPPTRRMGLNSLNSRALEPWHHRFFERAARRYTITGGFNGGFCACTACCFSSFANRYASLLSSFIPFLFSISISIKTYSHL